MKTVLIFILISISFIISCSEEATQPYNNTEIEMITVEKFGCNSETFALEKIGAIISGWSYQNDSLQIDIGYPVRCGEGLSNDVTTSENKIVIYLMRTGSSGARCTCTFKESLKFYAESPKKIEVFIYSKSRETGTTTYLEKLVVEI